MTRRDLKLDVERRKLAAVQAYCSYEWESSLRTLVLEEWDKRKSSQTFDDDEDPPEDAEGVEDRIPLPFKLKVVKEAYERLTAEQKKQIDRKREDDKRKMFCKIPDTQDNRERIEKLQTHQRYSRPLPPV